MTSLDTATYVATIHAPDGGWGDDDHDTIAQAIDEYGLTCMQVDDGGVWQMRTPINKKSISVENAGEGASRFGFKRITSLGTCAPARGRTCRPRRPRAVGPRGGARRRRRRSQAGR